MLLTDSSAIVKFVSKEPGWESIAGYMGDSLSLSLSVAELGSALRKKVIKKEVRQAAASNIINEYAQHTVLLDQNRYIGTALDIAIKNNLSIYDSLFIAAAAEEGYDLLTCDNKQSKIAKKIGVSTISV